MTALLRATIGAFELVARADRAFSLLPPYRLLRDAVLDRVLGPAESDEYVSRTAPAGPPPTIS